MLEFKRATVNDTDEFMRANIEAFSDDVKRYGFGPPISDDYEKEKELIQNYPTYKILSDGKIIGGITCCNTGDFYCLGGLFIIPSYQNLGIGTKAITFIENEFPDAKCWRLYTPYKNYRNHHFYEKVGYRKIGETAPEMDKGGFYMFEYEKKILK